MLVELMVLMSQLPTVLAMSCLQLTILCLLLCKRSLATFSLGTRSISVFQQTKQTKRRQQVLPY